MFRRHLPQIEELLHGQLAMNVNTNWAAQETIEDVDGVVKPRYLNFQVKYHERIRPQLSLPTRGNVSSAARCFGDSVLSWPLRTAACRLCRPMR